jgi:hypothetical protein
VHKNYNSTLFSVIALFSNLIFVQRITQKAFAISTFNFIGGYISLRRCAVHKSDNSTLRHFWVFALCYISYFLSELMTKKVLEVSTWNFASRRRAAHKNDHLPCSFFSYCPLLFSAISIHIGFKSVITSAISFHY